MRAFAALFERLDQTTKTSEKTAAMASYFAACFDARDGDAVGGGSGATRRPTAHLPNAHMDAAWAIHYLSGRRAKRAVATTKLRQWAAEAADIPAWLFDESYDVVGDLAETISLVVPAATQPVDRSLSQWVTEHVLTLSKLDDDQQRDAIRAMWEQTNGTSRLVLMKLITGAFRLGVSSRLVARALAEAIDLPPDVVAHRLMGNWQPGEPFVRSLLCRDTGDADHSRPYPFCLAHAIPTSPDEDDRPDPESAGIGSVDQFVAEWKWDGIRGQVIRRAGQTYVWSRGEDLMSGRWPEVEGAAECLPDGTVLDGEILASRLADDNALHPSGVEVLPFAQLQRRIGRKTVGKKLLAEVPVMFHAFDCLEIEGRDIRQESLQHRRDILRRLIDSVQPPHLVLNPPIEGESWERLAQVRHASRDHLAEGLMLKRLDSVYTVGRQRGTWWKWKVAPFKVDAVLIYAQRGHGKRASLYTDYTFAVWDDERLVPFAKAYSGLTDAEISRVERFVRDHTSERFGPVRSVEPKLVMELAFEGLQRSPRHKSGIATRFPRIHRWREDKRPEDADKLSDLLAMLPPA